MARSSLIAIAFGALLASCAPLATPPVTSEAPHSGGTLILAWQEPETLHPFYSTGTITNALVYGVAWLRDKYPEATYALMRVAIALFILPSGYDKVFNGGVYRIAKGNVLKAGFSPPEFWAWLVGGLEFFGVILLALGLFTRPVALMLAFEMAVITFRVHNDAGFFWTAHGYEYALLMLAIFVAFMIGGGGRYSLDRRIGREF